MNKRIVFIIGSLAMLAACTERPQTIGTAGRHDVEAYQGTSNPFAVQGWKQGDRNSWEQQLKTRTQMGQNDYNKVN
jgi:uncharacterized lipoprotein YajG